MRRISLKSKTVEELIERYVEIGLAQDEALLYDDHMRFNRLYDLMVEVEEELKKRPGDQRHALFALYEHPNAQIQLNATKETLAIAPKRARRELEEIADSDDFPQAGNVGMTIWALNKGIFKPT